MKIALAQINPTLGALLDNAALIVTTAQKAVDNLDANMVVFPELALTGYPVDDLLLRDDFMHAVQASVQQILIQLPKDACIILGTPWRLGEKLINAALVIINQSITHIYAKQALPNYGVFEEKRQFSSGSSPLIFSYLDKKIALAICEDLWEDSVAERITAGTADTIITINASPYEQDKSSQRQQILAQRTKQANCPIIYVNLVGGQDELVFDGGSTIINPNQEAAPPPLAFAQGLFAVELNRKGLTPLLWTDCPCDRLGQTYRALCMGLRDYVEKNGFPGVILGLSGGIDSALTLAIAHDALGPARVQTVMMPSQYTGDISLVDAQTQAKTLAIPHEVLHIDECIAQLSKLIPEADREKTLVMENLQARIRGDLLMALSNSRGMMLLSTSNKSELAVGYSTLYGDMCGGFCCLKDVYKGEVYQLANFRNRISPVIPQRVIDRPPSAELKEDQQDSDTLPSYEVLDTILKGHIEKGLSQEQLIEQGIDASVVSEVIKMLYRSEYKRRQGPPGVKITSKAFGRDRHYPMTLKLQSTFKQRQSIDFKKL